MVRNVGLRIEQCWASVSLTNYVFMEKLLSLRLCFSLSKMCNTTLPHLVSKTILRGMLVEIHTFGTSRNVLTVLRSSMLNPFLDFES